MGVGIQAYAVTVHGGLVAALLHIGQGAGFFLVEKLDRADFGAVYELLERLHGNPLPWHWMAVTRLR